MHLLTRSRAQKRTTDDVFGIVLRSMFYVLLSICYFLFSISPAHATTSDFPISTIVGTDTNPPTVPLGLVAVPVSTSVITLSWSTSTDDVLLAGYQVFRDSLQIATTTFPLYSDTSLSASTTYSYYVTAFDSSNNVSASSSAVGTTTLGSTTPPSAPATPEGGATYGSRAPAPTLISIEVIPAETNVFIRYVTSRQIRSVVKWGETSSFEMGSSAEDTLKEVHELIIKDLRPDTRYRFSIEGETDTHRAVYFGENTFKTLPSIDVLPPGIVTGLTVVREGDDVRITWDNPTDADFDYVRVVRSNRFYPSTEIDGWAVYEGSEEDARDDGVALPGTNLYYAVFAYDHSGNVSAGAVASLRILKTGDIEIPPMGSTSAPSSTLGVVFSNLQFFQDGEQVPVTGDTVALDGSRHITIAMPYRVLPEHLKTVLVRIVPMHDPKKELSFILRVNDAKTSYTARLAPFGVSGTFTVSVSVFDFETKEVGSFWGKLFVSLGTGVYTPRTEDENSNSPLIEIWHGLVFVLLLILILFLVLLLLRGGVEDKLSNREVK